MKWSKEVNKKGLEQKTKQRGLEQRKAEVLNAKPDMRRRRRMRLVLV